MKKAWSFFWLVIASCVAFSILMTLIEPYLWLIATVVILAILLCLALKLYRAMSNHRSHF